MQTLVIVESPSKAKTIKKYLGRKYNIVASVGHVRDLPKSRLGVDVKNEFEPKYSVIKGKEKIVSELKKAYKESNGVLLATDPDREGEAISWHLAYILGLDLNSTDRVTFNEITEHGISEGMANPRKIDMDLVNAQQARRILDRLVGYTLSPFLAKKIHKGLSAGRVQSVAVRIIVDREEEIRAFKPKEYWSIDALLSTEKSKKAFPAAFYGDKNGEIKLGDKKITDEIISEIEKSIFIVDSIKKSKKNKTPAPPFTTSTLQQECARKLNFQSRKTMKIAQELYEGVDIDGEGAVGLITYMRTDSQRLSQEALSDAVKFIGDNYGKEYLPSAPRVYKTRAGAQDGHEAIRPTSVFRKPSEIEKSLTKDQYRVYKIIWDRFVSCQMANSILETTSAVISAGKYIFKASGYIVDFDGFTKIYEESGDADEVKGKSLPKLEKGMQLDLKELTGNQHFTQAPPRYTEASLIKTLEENGIGRPSTYAATIATITGREYVERDGKSFVPTELGEVVVKLMKEKFPDIVNIKFTADVEDQLGEVQDGKTQWTKVLDGFWKGFSESVEKAKKEMDGVKLTLKTDETDKICPKCGRKMVVKVGRFGKFLACSGYPECKFTMKIVNETGAVCPKCGGKIIVKKSRKGKIFYGCSEYPKCDFVSWDPPSKENCPVCGKVLLMKKNAKHELYCVTPGCSYKWQEKDE
jgi:DNA topoisomerase-1